MAKSQWGRENPDSVDNEHVEFVAPHDIETVQERGFYGRGTDEDKHQYTLDGVTSRASTLREGVEKTGLDVKSGDEKKSGKSGRHTGEES